MSYCELILFRNNKPDDSIEYRNAWGGVPRIWSSMFDLYLRRPDVPYDNWMSRSEELWPLIDRPDIPEPYRAVMAATYDRAIVRRKNFPRYVKDLRKFVYDFAPSGNIDHLSRWADAIEALGPDVEAIGFYGTSVSDNLWWVWDESAEDSKPYDLSTGTDHFEVYDRLTQPDPASQPDPADLQGRPTESTT